MDGNYPAKKWIIGMIIFVNRTNFMLNCVEYGQEFYTLQTRLQRHLSWYKPLKLLKISRFFRALAVHQNCYMYYWYIFFFHFFADEKARTIFTTAHEYQIPTVLKYAQDVIRRQIQKTSISVSPLAWLKKKTTNKLLNLS